MSKFDVVLEPSERLGPRRRRKKKNNLFYQHRLTLLLSAAAAGTGRFFAVAFIM